MDNKPQKARRYLRNNPGRTGLTTASRYLIASVLSLCSTLAISQAGITPFEVEYDVGNNLITAGSAKLSLSKEGDEWIYSLITIPSGIFKLTGKGKIQEISVIKYSNERELQPKRYTYRQDEEAKRSVDAWFNWEENELTYKRRGQEVIEKINDPILDRLSVTLTVMEQLKAGFQQAALQVFDNGKIKTVVFENQGEVTLSTKLGSVSTVKVKSFNSDGSRKRVTTTWFAPSFDYVPVMMEQHKNGQLVARLTISKLKN